MSFCMCLLQICFFETFCSDQIQGGKHLLQVFCCIVGIVSVAFCINTLFRPVFETLLAGCIESLQDAFKMKKGWGRQPLLTATLQQCSMPLGMAVPFHRGCTVSFILSPLSCVAVSATLLHLQ